MFVLIVFVGIVHSRALGQLSDNFTDGNFTEHPAWIANPPTSWSIDNGRLRSNSSTASSVFYIVTPSTRVLNTQWEFWLNLQFNTSSANYVDVYLVSATVNLDDAANEGYFVRIGGTPDEISLYKRNGAASTILINGTDGVTNKANNALKIKVTCDSTALWTLSYNALETEDTYHEEGQAKDNTFTTSQYFGIKIVQSTPGFFNKHYFDDFYVGETPTDQTPPEVETVTVRSANEIEIGFSEEIEKTSAEAVEHYTVNHDIGSPLTALLQPGNRTVHLYFSKTFPNGKVSTINIEGISDLLGNTMSVNAQDFLFFQPVPAGFRDIVINEILPDPVPTVGLPEAEFVEIHNRSAHPFKVEGWTLSDGSNTGMLTSFILPPGEHLILCPTSAWLQFRTYGNAMALVSFPSLNNTGDVLVLKDNVGKTIDSVAYSLTWFRDDEKKDGGWSLELIDPDNVCAEGGNWIASEDENGGTPAKQNSVFASKPDLTGPVLLSVFPVTHSTLLVKFDEKLTTTLPSADDFVLDPGPKVSAVTFADATLTAINLKLETPLQYGTRYSLSVSDVYDCSGNVLRAQFSKATFALPEEAGINDLVVNEILFNPRSGGVDFVEVYNTSAKFINLKNWKLANFENDSVVNARTIIENDFLFEPKGYIVFTVNAHILKGEYLQSKEETFFQMQLPPFPDEDGSVALLDAKNQIIDGVVYSDRYHSPFLKDDEGVSLERISTEIPGREPQNWRSASSVTGYATPGYINSNSRAVTVGDDAIHVNPEIFIPFSSRQNFAQINYSFANSGYVANVKIFDAQGRTIKQIANNELLGATGFFRWDGDQDNARKAPIGAYMVWFEVFDHTGEVRTYRKRVVVADDFR